MTSAKTTPGWPHWRRIGNEPCVPFESARVSAWAQQGKECETQKCTSRGIGRQGIVLKHRNSYKRAYCPVVLCPSLCSSGMRDFGPPFQALPVPLESARASAWARQGRDRDRDRDRARDRANDRDRDRDRDADRDGDGDRDRDRDRDRDNRDRDRGRDSIDIEISRRGMRDFGPPDFCAAPGCASLIIMAAGSAMRPGGHAVLLLLVVLLLLY